MELSIIETSEANHSAKDPEQMNLVTASTASDKHLIMEANQPSTTMKLSTDPIVSDKHYGCVKPSATINLEVDQSVEVHQQKSLTSIISTYEVDESAEVHQKKSITIVSAKQGCLDSVGGKHVQSVNTLEL